MDSKIFEIHNLHLDKVKNLTKNLRYLPNKYTDFFKGKEGNQITVHKSAAVL